MSVPSQYDNSLSQQPAIIQGQRIEQDLYSERAPVVVSTFVTITTTCQECSERRRAKRIRQLNRGSREGRRTCCSYCPLTQDRGRECGCGFFLILLFCCLGVLVTPLFAIICLLVCRSGMLVANLVYACCAEEEEAEERCSTCGSII